MQNSDSRTDSGASSASRTTARHRPTQDGSAPPHDADPCDDECCDLVTVPARQGLEAVDILRRGAGETIGPVLHDGSCDTLGFLVPPGTADGWDLPGSACTQTSGHGMRLISETGAGGAGRRARRPPIRRRGHRLAAAAERRDRPRHRPSRPARALGQAARTIEAADNCR